MGSNGFLIVELITSISDISVNTIVFSSINIVNIKKEL